MNRSVFFLVACLLLTLQIRAAEREVVSEEIIAIKLAPDPIVCKNATTIGRGFVAYFPAEISIDSRLIVDASPMLDGIATFTFELPSSVTCENLQFNEMPRTASVTRRVYRQFSPGYFNSDLIRTLLVVESTLAIPVQMDGYDITLTGTMTPWISQVQKNGQSFVDYKTRIHPQAHPITCKPFDLEPERYVLAIPGVRSMGGDHVSNLNELGHIFSSQTECQEFHSQLLTHYHAEDPDNHGTIVTIRRTIEKVPLVDPAFVNAHNHVEQETLSMTLLGLDFTGTRTSFPL